MDDNKMNRMRELIIELLGIPSEGREREILIELDRISPDPSYLNYIYHSEDFVKENGDVDVESFLKKVFSYKPIAL